MITFVTIVLTVVATLIVQLLIRKINVEVVNPDEFYKWIPLKIPKKQFADFRVQLDRAESSNSEHALFEVPVNVNDVKHPTVLDILWRYFWRATN